MSDRCRYETLDDGERVLMPGCMGGAVYGEAGCTCDPPNGSNADLRQRIEELEASNDTLARQGSHTANRCLALEKRMRGLEDALAAMEARLAGAAPKGVDA